MNIEDQKEFIKSLFKISDSTSEKELGFLLKTCQDDIASSVFEDLTGDKLNEKITEQDIDELFDRCDELNIDPISIVELLCEQLTKDGKDLTHRGQTIPFSKMKYILSEAKEKFIKHKSEQDIKNY